MVLIFCVNSSGLYLKWKNIFRATNIEGLVFTTLYPEYISKLQCILELSHHHFGFFIKRYHSHSQYSFTQSTELTNTCTIQYSNKGQKEEEKKNKIRPQHVQNRKNGGQVVDMNEMMMILCIYLSIYLSSNSGSSFVSES